MAAARQQKEEQAVMSFVPLPAGVVTPGLAEPNLTRSSDGGGGAA